MNNFIRSLGFMITSKCNFDCDHCMFSCTMNGKNMNDEVLEKCQEFKEYFNINEISIFGGEPFLNIDFFIHAMKYLYNDSNDNLFISTNGSFIKNQEQTEKLIKWINNQPGFLKNFSGYNYIRISNTIYHLNNRSKIRLSDDMIKNLTNNSEYITEDECICEFDENNDDQECECGSYEYYSLNFNDRNKIFYLEELNKKNNYNPSGRAIKNHIYDNRELLCLLSDNTFNDIDEFLNDILQLNIYVNGDIKICCYCDSGIIGNVLTTNFEEIKDNILKFREQARKIIETIDNIDQRKKCDICRNLKIKNKELIIKGK